MPPERSPLPWVLSARGGFVVNSHPAIPERIVNSVGLLRSPGISSSVGRGIYADGDDTIRAEVFSIEQLEQHAESLARIHRVTGKPGSAGSSRSLQRRLKDNDVALRRAYRAIAKSIRANRTITPAAEWLIDNSHVVEKQIRDIRVNLPPGFYRQLPALADGPQKDR